MKSVFSNPNCYLLLLAMVIVSYFNIAPQYSALFHADIAVPILQANHFDFSSDWYYWGQNRLGSLVPLLSYLVHHSCGISAITSVGLINYLVLLSLFVVYAGFLKKDISKIALAFIIFFPYIWFGPLIWIAQPYSAQLLFLGLVIKTLRLITSGDLDTPKPPSMRVSLLLALSIFLSFLSVWMSDYSLVFLLYIYFDFSKKFLPKFFRFPLLGILQVASFTTISLFSCIVVLYLFKKSAGNEQSIATIFMSSPHFKESLKIYFSRFIDILFSTGESFGSFVFIFSIICMVYLRKAFVNFNNLFFVLLFLAIFPTITLDWIWVNELLGRYFTPVFFFLAFCLIQASETSINLKVSPGKLVCFLCVIQAIPILLYERGQSRYAQLSEFRKLGSCGIIGDYWNSYIIATANPDSIVASPHSGSLVRNRKLIDQIITKPAIYFVANDWLKNFPDSVCMFDHWFRRAKTPEFVIQNYTLSEYLVVPDFREFHLTHKNMTTPMGHLIRRDSKEYWLSEEDREGWVWFGPYMTLTKGDYDICFNVNVKPLTGNKIDKPVRLDICKDGGLSVLTEQAIQPSDYNKKQFVLSLSLKESISSLEFRIYKFNNSVVEVKNIIIRRR